MLLYYPKHLSVCIFSSLFSIAVRNVVIKNRKIKIMRNDGFAIVSVENDSLFLPI